MDRVWVFARRTLRFGGEDGAGQAETGAEEPQFAAVHHVRLVTVAVLWRVGRHGAGRRIEEQGLGAVARTEVEQILDRAGRGVDRTAAQTTTVKPVVFDEAHDGSLRDALVAHVVLLREGRHYDERDARARAATSVYRLAVQAVRLTLLIDAEAALAGTVDLVGGRIVGRLGRRGV